MTLVGRIVKRETFGTVFDRKRRAVIVSIEPPNLVGFRLKGTRRTYHLPSEKLFSIALKAHIEVEKAAKRKARRSRR